MTNLSHVIIVRAVGEDGKGASIQMKVGYTGLPPEGAETELRFFVARGFAETFGEPAKEIAVGTFPYIAGEDDDD